MSGARRTCPIRRRRSARAASASRPSAPATARCMNAIADAVGVDAFRRAPVTPDILLTTLEHGRRMYDLQAHV